MGQATGSETLHASCVTWADRAVVILGQSGSGKSALALTLMAYGCRLLADDRVVVTRAGAGLVAQCPAPIAGMIEARGIGILRATAAPATPVAFFVDLDNSQTARMPQPQSFSCLGCDLPLISRVSDAHFPVAILQLLKEGWAAT